MRRSIYPAVLLFVGLSEAAQHCATPAPAVHATGACLRHGVYATFTSEMWLQPAPPSPLTVDAATSSFRNP